jgi:hypothetical protein
MLIELGKQRNVPLETLWHIADVRDVVGTLPNGKPMTAGMAILRNDGWHGHFDMKNKQQRKRLHAYVD